MQGGIPLLKSFEIRNAYSFLDECVVDMEATNIKAHKYSLITSETNEHVPEKLSLLPVLSIYGANASGKTNLLRALLSVFNSITSDSDNPIHGNYLSGLKNSSDLIEGTTLKMTFILNRNEYALSFYFLAGEYFSEKFHYRKNSKGKMLRVYERNWDEKTNVWKLKTGLTINKEWLDEIEYVSSMERDNKNLLLYALCKRSNISLFSSLATWASRFSNAESPVSYSMDPRSLTTREKNPHLKIFNDKAYKPQIIEFVRSINPLIQSFNFVKDTDEKEMTYQLEFQYTQSYNDDDDVEIIDKTLTCYESRGVYSAITLLPSILLALKKGGLVIADELENSLHPLLMTKVINLFTDPDINVGGGQLIFTTHNALIMDKRYLRQDEIGFVEKDEDGRSEFYKLSDIDNVRSDLDFSKNYILGAFGAIPEMS